MLFASALIIPAVVPSRTLSRMRYAPIGFALLLPLIAFMAIGRTVEVKKLADEIGEDLAAAVEAAAPAATEAIQQVKRALLPRGLSAGSAGSGLSESTHETS